MRRREFLKSSAAGAALTLLNRTAASAVKPETTTRLALVRTEDRAKGIEAAMKLLSFPSPKGKKVFIKPNFNTADPAPGSTHNDTLRQLVTEMKNRGAGHITVGDSCGPGNTNEVMSKIGIPVLAQELGFEVMNFEELAADKWAHFNPPGSHWKNGFEIAKPVVDAEYLLWTCCLKTHQYGGVHSMSLKLAVGVTNKNVRMQMHQSPEIRRMIAEINHPFKPHLIVMDGVDIFVDGGPMTGKKVRAGVIIAGTDRVAVDAAGVAILKHHGSNEAIMSRKIFEQEQIARAVELELGVKGPEMIEILTGDEESLNYAGKIKEILAQG